MTFYVGVIAKQSSDIFGGHSVHLFGITAHTGIMVRCVVRRQTVLYRMKSPLTAGCIDLSLDQRELTSNR